MALDVKILSCSLAHCDWLDAKVAAGEAVDGRSGCDPRMAI